MVWACLVSDIETALACEADLVNLSLPISDIHITHKLKRDRAWILETLKTLTPVAQKQGADVTGRNNRIVLGKHSGTSGVVRVYEDIGLTLSEPMAREILMQIRGFAINRKYPPDISDLKHLYTQAHAGESHTP